MEQPQSTESTTQIPQWTILTDSEKHILSLEKKLEKVQASTSSSTQLTPSYWIEVEGRNQQNGESWLESETIESDDEPQVVQSESTALLSGQVQQRAEYVAYATKC
ncbi:hypothetical protein HDU79_001275, partial [Rhizoclosmatium sp. JEL0117]